MKKRSDEEDALLDYMYRIDEHIAKVSNQILVTINKYDGIGLLQINWKELFLDLQLKEGLLMNKKDMLKNGINFEYFK